jgi:hypothetical protein
MAENCSFDEVSKQVSTRSVASGMQPGPSCRPRCTALTHTLTSVQVAHLLLHGHLPNKVEFAAFMEVRSMASPSPPRLGLTRPPSHPRTVMRLT